MAQPQVIYIDSRTACNGSCETTAGCDCCIQRMPAEASTEIGAHQADDRRMWWQWLERVTPRQFWAAYVAFIAGCIAIASLWARYK